METMVDDIIFKHAESGCYVFTTNTVTLWLVTHLLSMNSYSYMQRSALYIDCKAL